MDKEKIVRIRKMHTKLRAEVKVRDILPILVEKGHINSDDFNMVNRYNTETAKMECLLFMLTNEKNNEAYVAFRKALEDSYSWLVEELDGITVSKEDIIKYTQDWKNQRITPEMIDLMRRNGTLVRKWQTLAHTLGLTNHCPSILMQSTLYMQDLDECLRHLITKWCSVAGNKANLGELLKALRKEHFNDIADQLEDSFKNK